jgi:hypothetical protein
VITNDRHSAAKRRFDDGGDWASAALAEGLGARIGAAATFVTTEHFNLQTARAVTVSEANGRATIYLAALSSNLIALAFIGQMSRLGVAFYAFALILLPVLAFVGVVTFLRLVQSSIEDIAYAHRIGLLRSFYLGVAPELEPYLVVVRKTRSAAPSDGERLAPSAWQLTLTAAGMVAVVNSVVMAASLVQALQRDTRQQSNGGQHEERRRRQCHFDGGCGTQDDRHGARGSDVCPSPMSIGQSPKRSARSFGAGKSTSARTPRRHHDAQPDRRRTPPRLPAR